MRRLHLRLYLTIVGTLVAFAFCAAILWHIVAWPQGAAWSIETATHLSANMLDEVHEPSLEQTIVDALANQLHGLVARGAPMDSLQRLYHDPAGGEREAENVPADKLPEAYAGPLARADSGAVVPVFTIKGPGDRDQYVVLKVTSRRSQGDIRFEDVKDRIRQQLGQELSIRRYIDQLRKTTYVELRI